MHALMEGKASGAMGVSHMGNPGTAYLLGDELERRELKVAEPVPIGDGDAAEEDLLTERLRANMVCLSLGSLNLFSCPRRKVRGL